VEGATASGVASDSTSAPDMNKPIVRRVTPEKKESAQPQTKQPNSRSHEISSLIGNTRKLQLKKKHIVKSVAFISNKGGVGKTHISTNISFYLSRMAKNALLIDLDLGNCDVTNKLGFYCDYTINDLLQGKRNVDKLIYSTPHGFDLIAGESGNLKLANMMAAQRRRFIKAFRELGHGYDFILTDLSAGISTTTLDFALAQDYQVIVTTPQDIVAGYSCIKAIFQRFMEQEMQMAKRDSGYKPRTVFRPFVVLNQVSSFQSGKALFEKMKNVVKTVLSDQKEFKIEINFLGVITADVTRIRESELQHFLYSNKFGASRTGQCFSFLAQNLTSYQDPNNIEFTTKVKRFVDIFMKSVEETKYAR
jgi:flagellar biosynthesis protein FlhG